MEPGISKREDPWRKRGKWMMKGVEVRGRLWWRGPLLPLPFLPFVAVGSMAIQDD